MALQNVTIQVTGAIICGTGGQGMQPGDNARMFLKQPEGLPLPGEDVLPEYADGVVQQPVKDITVVDPATSQLVIGTEYLIEYDDAQVPASLPALDPCDVISLECISCCDVLHTRIDALSGVQVGKVTFSSLTTQPVAATKTALAFETDEYTDGGVLSRLGNVFISSEAVEITVTVTAHVRQEVALEYAAIWAEINGTPVGNFSLRSSSGTSQTVENVSGTFTTTLAAGASLSFFAISDAAGTPPDLVAALPFGDAPALPSLMVDITAVRP